MRIFPDRPKAREAGDQEGTESKRRGAPAPRRVASVSEASLVDRAHAARAQGKRVDLNAPRALDHLLTARARGAPRAGSETKGPKASARRAEHGSRGRKPFARAPKAFRLRPNGSRRKAAIPGVPPGDRPPFARAARRGGGGGGEGPLRGPEPPSTPEESRRLRALGGP